MLRGGRWKGGGRRRTPGTGRAIKPGMLCRKQVVPGEHSLGHRLCTEKYIGEASTAGQANTRRGDFLVESW